MGESEAGTEMTSQNNRCYDWTECGVNTAQRMHTDAGGVREAALCGGKKLTT